MSKKPYVPAEMLTKLWRAMIEFDMIQEGDKILIGLSGGKDSQFMTAALAEARKHSPRHFDLYAYTVDGMFAPDFPKKELEDFCAKYGIELCDSLGLPFTVVKTDIAQIIFDERKESNPCSLCAKMRKGALNEEAKKLGCNKVALAHHNDDAVETLLLNLFNSGQLKTFMPSTYLTKSGITVIRPLLFYRESEIIANGKEIGLVPLKNPCPYDGKTQRQEMKEMVVRLEESVPHLYDHLAAALRRSEQEELWPEKLSQQAMLGRFRDFWKKEQG